MPEEKMYRLSELGPDLDSRKVRIGGWIQDIRNLGGIAFVLIRDGEGVIQLTILRKENEELFKELTSLPRESVLEAEGTVKANSEVMNGFEIFPDSFKLLSRADTPLPLGVVDKVGAELDTRLNNRFLDLRKEKVASIFRVRDSLLKGLRRFFGKEGFVEVHTPKIVSAGAEGGATLFPVEYFGQNAFLAQSPQLYKQMLMATGLNKVYEIAPAYRAEESDTIRHIAEFTSVDAEMAFISSSDDIMVFLERLINSTMDFVRNDARKPLELLGSKVNVPAIPFKRITHRECVSHLLGEGRGVSPDGDIDTEGEKLLGKWMKEEYGQDFYFITEFPTSIVGKVFYAKRLEGKPHLSCYFDLDYKGLELVSGGQREHQYDVLLRQLEENNLDRERFSFYLDAFRFGMPPHGGFGMGVERFLQSLLGLGNIRECVLFPRDRNRLVP